MALGFADLAVLNLLIAPRLLDRAARAAREVEPARVVSAETATATETAVPAPPAPPVAKAAVAEPRPPETEPSHAMADIVFELGRVEVPASRAADLHRVAEELGTRKRGLLVRGHSDRIGPSGSNMLLSFRRAEAVRRLLGVFGAPLDHVTVEATGDTEPLSASDTPKDWAKNRRAELLWR